MGQPVWNTASGSLGAFAVGSTVSIQLSASATLPGTTIRYSLTSGSLPEGLALSYTGLISGKTTTSGTSTFVVRASDNVGAVRDRTFAVSATSTAALSITAPAGLIDSINDSTWFNQTITTSSSASLYVSAGSLPPGLEMSEAGKITGYATPPLTADSYPALTIAVTSTSATAISCVSTSGLAVNRPITFTGTSFGGIVSGTTYFVKEVIDSTSFTVSTVPFGVALSTNSATGFLSGDLPVQNVGQPTIARYEFTVTAYTTAESVSKQFSLVIVNQNAPTTMGGPGNPPSTRPPTVLNTRPLTQTHVTDVNAGYYVDGDLKATLGQIQSGSNLSFRILGYDFDGDPLQYNFVGLPAGLVGSTSGWISGSITLGATGISSYSFSVSVNKAAKPTIRSSSFMYKLVVCKGLTGTIAWVTPASLGYIESGIQSDIQLTAISDVALQYRITGGSLPPGISLLSTGQLAGKPSIQPTTSILSVGESQSYSFAVEAYSPDYSVVTSTQVFTISVKVAHGIPSETIYFKATPSIKDRKLVKSLLTDTTIIPDSVLYRPADPAFGKAVDISFNHMIGVNASSAIAYLNSIEQNHYWKKLTLAAPKTAIARDSSGNIQYEIVYCPVIDDLLNPSGKSVEKSVGWKQAVNVETGDSFTSLTSVYVSFETVNGSTYYTSMSPVSTRDFYPNSLDNMSTQVSTVLGVDSRMTLLPKWMTSQQLDGSTLGFTPAWVICYTLPGKSKQVQQNITSSWAGNFNDIDFRIDRMLVDKSSTYNYNTTVVPNAWDSLPSAFPAPSPADSEDYCILFPHKNILPNS